MPGAHRDTDTRACGAITHATDLGVYVNGKLWAVEGDKESHGNGDLIATHEGVYICGKKVIIFGDKASGDNADHTPDQTKPTGHSDNVTCYGN